MIGDFGYDSHAFVRLVDGTIIARGAIASNDDWTLTGRVAEVLANVLAGNQTLSDVPRAASVFRAAGIVGTNGEINGRLRHADERHLYRMQIELSLRCNLQCAYCYSSSGPRQATSLDTSDVMALLVDAADMGVVAVDFTGGEFFLYPTWREVLTRARQLGLVVTVHTNGLLLTPKNIAVLSEVGVRSVQVSVDSHLSEVHDAARGRRGALDRTVRGARALRDAGVPLVVSMMVHRGNLSLVAESVAWFEANVGGDVRLDRVMPTGADHPGDASLTAAEFYEAVSPLLAAGRVASRVCDDPSESADKTEPTCGVGSSLVYVTAAGELALCPTMTSREEARFSGPNLATTTLREAWGGPFFSAHRDMRCANVGVCPAGRGCGGGCRSNAYIDSGSLHAPDVVACNIKKNPTTTFLSLESLYNKRDWNRLAESLPTLSGAGLA